MRLPPFRRAAPIQTPDDMTRSVLSEKIQTMKNSHGVTLAGRVPFRRIAILLALAACLAGCEDDGGGPSAGSDDFGDNDPNLYVALGDSLTSGREKPAGAPYPARLSSLLGKTVLNYGVGGDRSYEARARVGSALSRKPGYLLLLIGSNDGTHGADPARVKEDVRAIIQAAKNNKTVPVVATPPPMAQGWHEMYAGNTRAIASAIRAVAHEEHVVLVDIEKRFGSAEGLLQPDGLHTTDAGTQRIADSFYAALR